MSIATVARSNSRITSGHIDATAFLTLYAVLLVLIPSNLIVEPLGAAGTPANILGIVALFWWICARMLAQGGAARGPQPVRISMAVVGLAVVASFAACALRAADALELNGADRGLLLVMAWAGPLLVAADGIRSLQRLDDLLRRVTVIVSVMAMTGIVAFVTHFDVRTLYVIPGLTPNHVWDLISWKSRFARVAGTAGHPIEFGVVLAVWLPIAVHYAMATPKKRAGRYWLCVCLIGLAIPMSISRSAVLSVAVAAIVLIAVWSWRLRLRALIVVSGFLATIYVAIPGLLGTLKNLFLNFGSDNSVKGRTDDYSVVGRYIAERPFFGRGFRTFLATRYPILDNEVLGTIIELGFVGLAAVIVFLFTGFFTARGARRRSSNANVRHLGQALAAAIAAAAIGFVTFDFFSFPLASGLLFLVVGCAGALWRLGADVVPNASLRQAFSAR